MDLNKELEKGDYICGRISELGEAPDIEQALMVIYTHPADNFKKQLEEGLWTEFYQQAIESFTVEFPDEEKNRFFHQIGLKLVTDEKFRDIVSERAKKILFD